MSASLALIWLAILYLLYELYSNRRNPRFVWSVWRRFNLLMLLEVVCLSLVVAAAFIAIIELFPITSYGWTSLMVKNSTNIMFAPATLIPKNGQLGTKVFGVFFLLLFLLAVPFMAKAEEDLFRRGKSGPKSIVINSIYFGLSHLIVGVPLGVALALIIQK